MNTKNSFIVLVICLAFIGSIQAQWKDQAIVNSSYDQNEPVIALRPTNPDSQMVVYMNYTSTYSSYPGYAFSTNRGSTWTSGNLAYPSGYNMLMLDPSAAFARSGRAYYCYGSIVSQFNARADIFVSYTDNIGASWTTKKLSGSVTQYFNDKPWITVDNTGGDRNGWVYVTWVSGNDQYFSTSKVYFCYSSDAGANWSTPSVLQTETDGGGNQPVTYQQTTTSRTHTTIPTEYFQNAVPVVGKNGDVYVLWGDYIAGTYSGSYWGSSQWLIRRSTNGTSFGPVLSNMPYFTEISQAVNSNWDGMYVSNIPTVDADQSNGYLYVVYPDPKNWDDSSPQLLFTMSVDNGSNWSTPAVIGNNIGSSETKWEFMPSLKVNSGGSVSLGFVHLQDDLSAQDMFIMCTDDHGSTWTIPSRVTAQSSNISGQSDIFDYMGIAVAGNQLFTVWTDQRNGNEDLYESIVAKNPSSPWSGNIFVTGSPSYSALSINSGAQVEFNPVTTNSMLTVNGSFTVSGTSNSHVKILSSRYPNPQPGDWYSINLYGGPNNVQYCDIFHGIYDVYVHNSNSSNAFTNCTFQNASGYGVYSYLTLNQPNAVKFTDCTFSSNYSGLYVGNSRVDFLGSVPTDQTKGVINNSHWGTLQYDGARLYMSGLRVVSNGGTNSAYHGMYLNGSTAVAVFSADSSAAGNNYVGNNAGNQIHLMVGTVFLGDATRGGSNHIYGNCNWIYNATGSTIKAEHGYWGSPITCPPSSGCFSGLVDYTNCYSSGMAPTTIAMRPFAEENRDLLKNESPVVVNTALVDPVGYVQYCIDSRDYDAVLRFTPDILQGTLQSTETQFLARQRFHAMIGKGDLAGAASYLEALGTVGKSIDPMLFKALREVLQIETHNTMLLSGKGSRSFRSSTLAQQPNKFKLEQNYPNPFNPSTTITYELSEDTYVQLIIYNSIGQQVAVLADGFETSGTKALAFDASGLSSGVYYYALQAGGRTLCRKFTLLK